MHIQINIDTNEPLTAADRELLATLAGESPTKAAPAPAKKATPAPAKKATPPPAAEPDEAPEEAPEEVAEEVAEEATGEVTMSTAVSRATKLVSEGKAAKVKEALAQVGVSRVSEVPKDQLGEFVAALG